MSSSWESSSAPSGLGWVEINTTIEVLALVGLAILLFLSGPKIHFDRLRGRLLGLIVACFAVPYGIAIAVLLVPPAAVVVDALATAASGRTA